MKIKLKTIRKLVRESILREEATGLAKTAVANPAQAVNSLHNNLIHAFQSKVPNSKAEPEKNETRAGHLTTIILAPARSDTEDLIAAVQAMTALLSGFKDDNQNSAMGNHKLGINKYMDLGNKGMSLEVLFHKVATGMKVQTTSNAGRRSSDGDHMPEEPMPTKWRLEVFVRRPVMHDD